MTHDQIPARAAARPRTRGTAVRRWSAMSEELPPPADQDASAPWWAGHPAPLPIRRRSRAAVAASVAAILLVLFFGAAGVVYRVLHRTGGPGPSAAAPAATAGSSAAATPSTPGGSGTPTATAVAPAPGAVATVQAYYAAINQHRYTRAWRLGGRNTGSSYQSFVSGFATTAHDRVTIQFVSGNIVTAELTARLTDGTVNTYQGTYFVHHGVITRFNVHQIG
jgi:hypothetical protein